MLVHMDFRSTQQRYYVQPQARRRSMKSTHKSLITWHLLAAFYYFYHTSVGSSAHSLEENTFLDLSHKFDNTTIYWVSAKKLNLTVTHNGTDPTGQYWYQTDEISAGTHGGTHMDAPCHFAAGRWCVSDVPLEHLLVPAVVVDISNDVQDKPTVHLTPDHLVEWEKIHGKIPDGSLLLVRTGWSRFWPDPLRYTGTTERKKELLRFPSIKPEAAKWLVDNRKIVGVGIDTMSLDIANGSRGTHTTLMDKNIYGLENLNMFVVLPPKGLKAYVMPMRLKDASGAPCRVLVELPKDGLTSGNVGTVNSLSLIWTTAFLATLLTFS